MIPWITLKTDLKIRKFGILLSSEPLVVYLIYFNLIDNPYSSNNSSPLWGSQYVLSAIVSLILAVLAWHVRKNINKNQSST
jgi:hypothetical protein